jgi:hypothetical protein
MLARKSNAAFHNCILWLIEGDISIYSERTGVYVNLDDGYHMSMGARNYAHIYHPRSRDFSRGLIVVLGFTRLTPTGSGSKFPTTFIHVGWLKEWLKRHITEWNTQGFLR